MSFAVAGLVDCELEGASHRTQAQNLVVHVFVADVEHLVLVVIPVSRNDKEVVFGHNRGFVVRSRVL